MHEKLRKRRIRIEILNLLDHHCKDCPDKALEERCNNQCEIGRQLRTLGASLEDPTRRLKQIQRGKALEAMEEAEIMAQKGETYKEQYVELAAQGLLDKEIAKKIGIKPAYLSALKKKWGLRKADKMITDTVDKKNQKQVDEEIKTAANNVIPIDKNERSVITVQDLENELAALRNQNQELRNQYDAMQLQYEIKIGELQQQISELVETEYEMSMALEEQKTTATSLMQIHEITALPSADLLKAVYPDGIHADKFEQLPEVFKKLSEIVKLTKVI